MPTDHSTTECDPSTKMNVARHSQMIQVDDIRDLLESWLEVSDLTMHDAHQQKTKIPAPTMLQPS